MPESEINIQNVVASTKLAESFDLISIESELEGAEYNKAKFPGMVYRVTNPKAAFLIFTSGKVKYGPASIRTSVISPLLYGRTPSRKGRSVSVTRSSRTGSIK